MSEDNDKLQAKYEEQVKLLEQANELFGRILKNATIKPSKSKESRYTGDEKWIEEKARMLITMVSKLYPHEASPCVIPKSKAEDFIRNLLLEIQLKVVSEEEFQAILEFVIKEVRLNKYNHKIIGQKIKSIRLMNQDEVDYEGWNRPTVVLELENGVLLYPSRDEEGNDAGELFGRDAALQLPITFSVWVK